ncbi:MAG: DUF1835 domain-containing protein [Acidobacteriota bacterium]
MRYHVLAGDALAADLAKTKIDGDTIVCREALIAGDVDSDSLPEFWDRRARFIAAEYGEDEIVYHETVADELSRLLDMESDDEVCLWFEYELFCSANLWFCLWLLNETDARVFRVQPIVRSEEDRWLGFGKLEPVDLVTCWDARVELSRDDVRFGADLWNAYRKGDFERLAELSGRALPDFPYLSEVAAAAADRSTRPAAILAEIDLENAADLTEIFPEFTRRAGVYGLGDLQVQRLLDQLSSSTSRASSS